MYGNPDLRPEHSDNVTAGAEWSAGRTYVRGQLFWNRLRDFIETRPVPSSDALVLYEYGNVDQGLTQGADVEAGVVLGGRETATTREDGLRNHQAEQSAVHLAVVLAEHGSADAEFRRCGAEECGGAGRGASEGGPR